MTEFFKRNFHKDRVIDSLMPVVLTDSMQSSANSMRGYFWQNVYKLALNPSERTHGTVHKSLAASIVNMFSIGEYTDALDIDLSHLVMFDGENDEIRELEDMFDDTPDMVDYIYTHLRDVISSHLIYTSMQAMTFNNASCVYDTRLGLVVLLRTMDVTEVDHLWVTVIPDSRFTNNSFDIAEQFLDNFKYVGVRHELDAGGGMEKAIVKVLTDLDNFDDAPTRIDKVVPRGMATLTPEPALVLHPLTWASDAWVSGEMTTQLTTRVSS